MTTTHELAVRAIDYHQSQHDHPCVIESMDEIVDTLDLWIESYYGDPQRLSGVIDLRSELMKMRHEYMYESVF